MSAIRAARGYTGREKIVKFIGCYHGHGDSLLVKAGSGAATFGQPDSPGVTAGTAKDTLTVPYNDAAAFKALMDRNGDDIAAVIVEPIAGNMGLVLPQEATSTSSGKKRRNTARSSSSTKSCAASARPSMEPKASTY